MPLTCLAVPVMLWHGVPHPEITHLPGVLNQFIQRYIQFLQQGILCSDPNLVNFTVGFSCAVSCFTQALVEVKRTL